MLSSQIPGLRRSTTLASAVGVKVLGIDPAGASLEIAKAKAGAERVTWHHGDATTAPEVRVDLAVMTGNVAQVFISDDEWLDTLRAIRSRLDRRGHLVYETRRPGARAWQQWAEPFEASATFDGAGLVRQSRELLEVDLPLVSFRYTYDFPDGSTIESETTLRFREDSESQELLRRAGFRVTEVRDAADRPGLEYVYFASPS